MTVVTLVIDGQDVAAEQTSTVLEASRAHGIAIPTLCHLDGLPDVGACRLCLVEVAGRPRPLPACLTTVEEGMVVETATAEVVATRRAVVELLFTERNHVCSVCVADRNCELQDLAADLGVDHLELEGLYPLALVDVSHERFGIDHNRCILCTRCVRVCGEIEGAHTWDVAGRGAAARLVTDLGVPWGSSTTCTSCGKCVQVCPTGALFEKGRSVAEARRRRPYLPFTARTGGAP